MSPLRLRPVAWSALLVLTAALLFPVEHPVFAQTSSAQPTPPLPPDIADATTRADSSNEVPPAHLAVADGAVTVERDNTAEPAAAGVALIPGDRIRTDQGRAEIYFPDGAILDLDEFTTVELQGPGLLRMTAGRMLLTLARPATGAPAAGSYEVDTPAASTTLDAPGEYRVGMLGSPSAPQLEVAVVRGQAQLFTDRGSLPVHAGERTLAWADGAASYPERFNSARFDAFDRWTAAQRDQRTGTRSAQYLPPDLRTYSGAFDRYGTWQPDPSYGYVWYPTVAAGWQPYYDGYWSPLPRFGWTWTGLNLWSWPTHHYGRWGVAGSRWFWIPDRRWGPGWVAWGSAPGYVSWTPLGFGNRPVFGISAGFGGAWGGWTVVPRQRFGVRGSYVRQYAVPGRPPADRSLTIRPSVAPPLPPQVAAARGVVSRPSARSRIYDGGSGPQVVDLTRRSATPPRAPLPRAGGAGVVPRYPGGASGAAFGDRGIGPAGSPPVRTRVPPGAARIPPTTVPGAVWGRTAGNPSGVPRDGGVAVAPRRPSSRFPGNGYGGLERAPVQPGWSRPPNGIAPRRFDNGPPGIGPVAPYSAPSGPGGRVMPRFGAGGIGGGESRGLGPMREGSRPFAEPRAGRQPVAPGVWGGGGVVPRFGGPREGGAVQGPSGQVPGGDGTRSPGSRRPPR